jgi:PKD repeat protein
LLKEKRILLVAATGLFLVFAVFTAPLFSIISFTLREGGFTQWNVVDAADNNPYQFMQQAYAQGTEPEVEEEEVPEEGGGAAEPLTTTSEEEEEEQPPPPSPPSPPPLTASINIDSTNGDTAPATFLFETEAEGGTEPYTFSWNFGDGSPQSNEQNTEHTFANPGTYVVSLTVTDSAGETVSDREEVIVRPAGATTPTEEPQPPTNATTTTSTPTPQQPTEPGQIPEQNQTDTPESVVVEAISCAPPLMAGPPIVLKSGNGPIGTTDPLNQFSTGSGGTSVVNASVVNTWSPAFIVQPHPLYHLINGTQYISIEPTLPFLPTSSDTFYRVTFTLPPNFTNPSLNIQIHADNAATIYLNPTTPLPDLDNQIGAQPQTTLNASNFQDPTESFSTSSPALFKTGINTLYFLIYNADQYTAFDYLANVQYCVPGISTAPVDDDEEPGGGPSPVVVTCQQESATIVGTSGDDKLVGTQGRDVIAALAGNDRVEGRGGNDLICGDEGRDALFGGEFVLDAANTGIDAIYGGVGDDQTYGGDGDDYINGMAGRDLMYGEAGNNEMFGEAGNDVMSGGDGDDLMRGGADNDNINGNDGRDFMFGEAGDDQVGGGIGNDEMDGGAGDDGMGGGIGDDIMSGGDGNDGMGGGIGNDEMDGGAGDDSLDSREGIVNNDNLDGGSSIDYCTSDPDPEVNCEF